MTGVMQRGRFVATAAVVLAAVTACIACGRAYEPGESSPGGAEVDAAVDAPREASSLAADSDGGSIAGDSGGAADGAADPQSVRSRIFLTSSKVTGSFGGLAAADAKCAALATSRGLHGAYKAWLSGLIDDAYGRIKGNGPWYRIDGTTLVFGSRGTIQAGPVMPILEDEDGAVHLGEMVWTGTGASGASTLATCDSWGSPFATGTIGESDKVGPSWTEAPALTAPCNMAARLICMRAD